MSEELAQLVSELPAVFEQVLAALPSILPAIAYYQSFVQYTTQRCVAMVTIKAPMSIKLFHTTSYLLKHTKMYTSVQGIGQ